MYWEMSKEKKHLTLCLSVAVFVEAIPTETTSTKTISSSQRVTGESHSVWSLAVVPTICTNVRNSFTASWRRLCLQSLLVQGQKGPVIPGTRIHSGVGKRRIIMIPRSYFFLFCVLFEMSLAAGTHSLILSSQWNKTTKLCLRSLSTCCTENHLV